MLYEDKPKEWLNEHFFYEVQMLNYSKSQLDKLQQQGDIYTLSRNMAMENFLMHVRNLLEFLGYGSDKDKGYARAVDFIPNWRQIKPSDKPQMSYMNRLNAEITHLGRDRIIGKPEEKNWQVYQIYQDYMILVKLFLENLPVELKGNNLMYLENEILKDSKNDHYKYNSSTESQIPPLIRQLN